MQKDPLHITVLQNVGTVWIKSGPMNLAIDGSDFNSDQDWQAAILEELANLVRGLRLPID